MVFYDYSTHYGRPESLQPKEPSKLNFKRSIENLVGKLKTLVSTILAKLHMQQAAPIEVLFEPFAIKESLVLFELTTILAYII